MRRPLPAFVLPTSFLIAGIWWQLLAGISFLLLQVFTLATCFALLVIAQHAHAMHACVSAKYVHATDSDNALLAALLTLFFFSGALLFCAHKMHHAIIAARFDGQFTSMTGRVYAIQRDNTRARDTVDLYTFACDNEAIHACIRCSLPAKSNIEIGDYLHINDTPLGAPKGRYRLFLERQGISLTSSPTLESTTLLSRPLFSIYRLLDHLHEHAHTTTMRALSSQSAALVSPMFFGIKAHGDTDSDQFLFTGTSHLLARSGLHVALCLLLWRFLLGVLPIPLFMQNLLLLCFALLYGALTRPSISFLRGLAIFVLYTAGSLLGRRLQFLHLLTFCCLCILLWNPYHLFFLDFQLTFGITFALAFAYHLG